jgi:putative transposase
MNGRPQRRQRKLAKRRKLWHNVVMAKYWKGDHTTHKLRYHLVWIPKYRKRVLRGEIAAHVKRLLFEACEMNRWGIEEITVQEDHIHLIIQFWPRESVAEVVQILKGGTSRIIRKTHPELKEFLWGDSLWADGYFAETIGSLDEEIVKKYIRDQRQ